MGIIKKIILPYMPAGLRKFLDDKKERIRQVSLPEKPHRFAYTPEAIIFNVDNFNIWFNDFFWSGKG